MEAEKVQSERDEGVCFCRVCFLDRVHCVFWRWTRG
jgi:hypothetical protein